MGDVVHVSFRKHSVSIFGAVNKEGEYEFLPGDTLGDLVTLAKGLNRSKPLISADSGAFKRTPGRPRSLSLGSAKETLEELNYETIRHIELRPNDAIFIRAQSLWQSTLHGRDLWRGQVPRPLPHRTRRYPHQGRGGRGRRPNR